MTNMNEPGYESLAQVLQEAYDQAARGKGAERHANDLPFHEQPMQQIARRRGLGFLLGQVDKKTQEAQGMLERGDRAAWRREILGAINYLAGALVFTDASETSSPWVRQTGEGAVKLDFEAACAVVQVPNSSESDSPQENAMSDPDGWFGAHVAPFAGRKIQFETHDGDKSVFISSGARLSTCLQAKRWRYVD